MGMVKRWWRGQGFGVHSPFAFRFITETLHCPAPYGYYAYPELKRLWQSAPRHGRMPLRRMLAIYRTGLRFAPATVELHGSDPHGLAAAALATAAAGSTDTGGKTARCLIFTNMAGWNEATAAMTCGMSFTDGRWGVIVADERLPLQHFEVDI